MISLLTNLTISQSSETTYVALLEDIFIATALKLKDIGYRVYLTTRFVDSPGVKQIDKVMLEKDIMQSYIITEDPADSKMTDEEYEMIADIFDYSTSLMHCNVDIEHMDAHVEYGKQLESIFTIYIDNPFFDLDMAKKFDYYIVTEQAYPSFKGHLNAQRLLVLAEGLSFEERVDKIVQFMMDVEVTMDYSETIYAGKGINER